ncbi:MAG TPA: HD domain-containing phosphohydrolase [Polyangiaceae bacterium]|nr:HD domain-containing phosphohydrolase [Polyangiaceae bacterium]
MALAIELGLGVPANTIHRTAVISARLARGAGHDEADVVAAYYLAVLCYVGCTTTSHETSEVVDELALGDLLVATDEEFLPELERAMGKTVPASATPSAAQALAQWFARPEMGQHHRNHCEAAELMAKRLELGPRVVGGLTHVYERWDGISTQQLAAGEGISLPMRVVHVAWLVGQESATKEATDIARRLRIRAGRSLDPTLATLAANDISHLLSDLTDNDPDTLFLESEPGDPVVLSGQQLDRALTCIADFGDLKSPHMIGHSRRVAQVAHGAARAASMTANDVDLVTRAALVHDIGRVGLQSSLLAKTGPLSRAEHERIRLHSYYTERIFAANPLLAPVGELGATHHEHLDGSGYHRGLQASAMAAPARLLAAANSWCSLTETRPHRPALTESEACSALRAHADQGLLDRNAVDAVTTSVGQRGNRTRRAARIALTEREVEVLRLVAREQTNPSIAQALGISPKTVERHVTHIYEKIGVSSRAGAAIHALENGLM